MARLVVADTGTQARIEGRICWRCRVAGRKITAVFSGKDTEVLKLIKQNADGLTSALKGRGLVLVDLKIEERK